MLQRNFSLTAFRPAVKEKNTGRYGINGIPLRFNLDLPATVIQKGRFNLINTFVKSVIQKYIHINVKD